METIEKLTMVQQKLVNELINEFTKINPKSSNGESRFSFNTINDCIKEEERFKQTIAKHNQTMMNVFTNQLENDVKEFLNEFGEVLDIKYGFFYENGNSSGTLESMLERNYECILSKNDGWEVKLFFVSKVNNYHGDYRYDYFNGKVYHSVYVDFKRAKVNVTLESGKEVSVYKIVGLQYNIYEWLHRDRDNNKTFSTLDELIQSHKPTQQNIVRLVQ